VTGPKPKKGKASQVAAGQASYSIAGGKSAAVTLTLNAAAQKLLEQSYSLPAALSLTGGATGKVTFSYARISALVLFTVAFAPSGSTFTSLTASSLPASATVTVKCGGGTGCKRVLHPKGRSVNLTLEVAGKRFRAGAAVTVAIAAPNRVGLVDSVVFRGNSAPKFIKQCQPPGQAKPSACH
jgi:hypothetical protein